MKRRSFIKLSTAAAAVAASGAVGVAARAAPGQLAPTPSPATKTVAGRDAIRLRIALPAGDTTSGPGDTALEFCRQLEAIAPGRFKLETLESKEWATRAARPATAQRVLHPLHNGTADITFGCEHDLIEHEPGLSYFGGVPGRMISFEANTFWAWATSARADGIWSELTEPMGYKALPVAHLGASPALWTTFPVMSRQDLAGHTLYAPGLTQEILTALGAKGPAASLSLLEAPAAIASGDLAGIEAMGLSAAMQTGIHKRARFATTLGLNPGGLVLSVRIAAPVWKGLELALKDAILRAAAATYSDTVTLSRLHQRSIAEALNRHHGVTFLEPPADILAAASDVTDAVLAHASSRWPRCRQLDKELRDFRARLRPPEWPTLGPTGPGSVATS